MKSQSWQELFSFERKYPGAQTSQFDELEQLSQLVKQFIQASVTLSKKDPFSHLIHDPIFKKISFWYFRSI